jgi:large subunit ribosomal protein L18
MARDSRYCTSYRRRREGKTDYHGRRALIMSRKPRVVVRGSLKSMIAQVVTASPEGDKVIVSAHSNELARKYGWKAPRGNLPTAYLTGLLCGLKAEATGIREAIPDIGLHSPSRGARVFAALKGVQDAGVDVPHSEEKLPDEKRLRGEHIVQYARSLAPDTDKYRAKFSKYLERKLSPESVAEDFSELRKEIEASFKGRGKKT